MSIALFIFKWFLIGLSPLIGGLLFWFVYYYAKGYRFKKGQHRPCRRRGKIRRILVDFPRQFVLDRYNLDPDMFREFGVHVIVGEQGSGKSITLTYMLMRFQKMYPRMVVKSNYGYRHQDGEISHWKDIVSSTNGIYGEIDVLDEIQNWFNSTQSKNFPPEMLTEITQQRKQIKCIFGTAQVFERIAKPIREQITYLYSPVTILGCLTVVRKYKPLVSGDDGRIGSKKLRGCFFFVHDAETRESFDTYRKIEKMANAGFKTESEQIRDAPVSVMQP